MPSGDRWESGSDYESFVGRWSRLVSTEFLDWLGVPEGSAWLDVGCGTGALTQAVLDRCAPAVVVGVDPSDDFVAYARHSIRDRNAVFLIGDAAAIPLAGRSSDASVSGLVLNFVPDAIFAVREMARVTRPGGIVGAYVWDYAERMQPLRVFWDAAVELDGRAVALDEGVRFPFCNPDAMRHALTGGGLDEVHVREIEVEARFRDFDDYWRPFLSGVGPAPGYCTSLQPERRERLRELLRSRLEAAADGSITLRARAWAASGLVSAEGEPGLDDGRRDVAPAGARPSRRAA